ncbi:MAG: preprotein translocase subunit Sec61beta [Halobacteriota archaeon]|nr:preprotein translocase subunit Sec61beta [Halobacteriota archaeon]
MPKKSKKSQGGVMSSAGLMRYFDTEESAIKIPPKIILASGIAAAVVIMGLNAYF